VLKDDAGELVGNVARSPCFASERVVDDELAFVDLEGAGREREGLQALDLSQPFDGDQIGGGDDLYAKAVCGCQQIEGLGLTDAGFGAQPLRGPLSLRRRQQRPAARRCVPLLMSYGSDRIDYARGRDSCSPARGCTVLNVSGI